GRTLDSNGPNVKIRGSSHQIFERYVALAREASTSGDRVAAENLYQHAEHYFRVMNAAAEGHQPASAAYPRTDRRAYDLDVIEPQGGDQTHQDSSPVVADERVDDVGTPWG